MKNFEVTISSTAPISESTLNELIVKYNAAVANVDVLARTCKDWRDYGRAVDEANRLWQEILASY